MELIPILSTIVLVATISTFLLAIGAYILFKIREKKGIHIYPKQPSCVEAELVAAEAVPEEAQPELVEPEAEAVAVPEEEPSSLDELFALRPDILEFVTPVDSEDEDEDDADRKKKAKKKKKKFVEMEYDPDKDVVVYKKKRKRGDDWDINW